MFSDKAKSVWEGVKALFIEAPAAPVTPAFSSKVYKTADGTEVTVEQAGDVPAAGEKVMIAGAPATAGTWALEDGSSLVTDESGLVVSYTAAAPAAPAAPVTPVTQMSQTPQTPEEIKALYDSFGTGTPEEQIQKLAIVCKALMENCFGWQLREEQEKASREQALAVYKNGFEKQDEKLTAMFEFFEELIKQPTAAPITAPENRRTKFLTEKEKADERMRRMGEAIKAIKHN